MSKKSKPRPGSGPRSAGTPPVQPAAPAAQLQAVHASAWEAATEEDLAVVVAEDTPPPPPGTDLVQCWKIAREARTLLDQQQKRAAEAERRAEAARARCEKEQADLAQQRARVAEEQGQVREESARLATQREAHDRRERELADREHDLLAREADALAGFSAQHRKALAALREEIRKADEELGAVRGEVGEARAAWRTEEGEQRAALWAELDRLWNEGVERLRDEGSRLREQLHAERVQLDAERSGLDRSRAEVRAALAELETEKALLDADREGLRNRVDRLVDERVEETRAREAQRERQVARLREERDRLQARLEEREEADRRFGHRAPEDVLADLERQRTEVGRLNDELALRPGLEALDRLRTLERERTTWEGERFQLVEAKQRLEADLGRRLVAVTEVQALRDQVKVLEAYRDIVQQKVAEFRDQADSLTAAHRAAQVFPAAAGMDAQAELQAEPVLEEEEVDLAQLLDDVRHRIADAPEPLFYRERDLRVFIAGLAMSRLHVLQGISGTGKTSLPRAFARAVGAGCTLVEVQAGWRSREDLLGHYNAFEHRFYESEFLQALYRAQTPRHRGRPYVVVLDEMNLSHPEHYFADLLSLLERGPEEQRIALLTAPAPGAPRHMQDGRFLRIPENVWMVGTANHDETTREFADKTYDRAHIMELPHTRERFPVQARAGGDPLSFRALDAAFKQARSRFAAECESGYARFAATFTGMLRPFDLGWGNRFERQMQRFHPVVRAAGGTAGEAFDHLLATKLLRKLRDRHGLEAERLERLRDDIVEAWPRIDEGSEPVESVALLEREIRAKGGQG